MEIVIAVIGVAGTILGTVLGWALNSFSQRGKLSVYVFDWSQQLRKNEMGRMVCSVGKNDAESYSYTLKLDVYNSSNETKIMRDIRVGFMKGKECLFLDRPQDNSTARTFGHATFFEEITPINVPAKSVISITMHGGFWKDDDRFERIWDVNEIVLLYLNNKNRENRIQLSKGGVNAHPSDSAR